MSSLAGSLSRPRTSIRTRDRAFPSAGSETGEGRKEMRATPERTSWAPASPAPAPSRAAVHKTRLATMDGRRLHGTPGAGFGLRRACSSTVGCQSCRECGTALCHLDRGRAVCCTCPRSWAKAWLVFRVSRPGTPPTARFDCWYRWRGYGKSKSCLMRRRSQGIAWRWRRCCY